MYLGYQLHERLKNGFRLYVKVNVMNVIILLHYGRQVVQPYVKQTETVNGSFVRPKGLLLSTDPRKLCPYNYAIRSALAL